MEIIPLYPDGAAALVESAAPSLLDPTCRRCRLGARGSSKSRCMAAEGEPGGLLVVSDYPGYEEDSQGRPFVGKVGAYLRGLLGQWWKGPLALTNALLCRPAEGTPGEDEANACRGYLARTIQEVQPTRVVALGAVAALGLTGRSIQPFSARGGYCWLTSPVAPVFFGMNPAVALRNRFVRGWFEEDLHAALTREPPDPPPALGLARVVLTATDAEEAARTLEESPWFAYDTETFGVMYHAGFRVLCAGLCGAGADHAWVWGPEALRDAHCRDVLAGLVSDPRARVVCHNAKYDGQATRLELGVTVWGRCDTLLMRRLVDSEADGDLDSCAELVGMGGHKLEAKRALEGAVAAVKEIAQQEATGQVTFSFGCSAADREVIARVLGAGHEAKRVAFGLLPRKVLLRYVALDAITTARLEPVLRGRLDAVPEIRWVWGEVVSKAAFAVERMEAWGIAVDPQKVEDAALYFDSKIAEALARMRGYGDFDPDSPPDVRRFLFTTLGLQADKKTPTGLDSTDADALEELKGKHPVVPALLGYREWVKFKGTNVEALRRYLAADRRVHSSFRIDGARSGRMSSTEPNLQNIPKRSEDAKLIRDCFVAAPGRLLVSLDYSQIELRVAAMLSGDREMIRIYQEGLDYHQRTAELICERAWGVPPDRVEPRHRDRAKTCNFAILYGANEYALSKQLNVGIEEARLIVDSVKGAFTTFTNWCKARVAYARSTGLTWTYWKGERARRRSMYRIAEPGDDDAAKKRRETAERAAFNTPVQGSANEYALASLIEIERWIREEGLDEEVKLVLTVHDEILLEVVEPVVEEAVWQCQRIMQGWPTQHAVPLVAEAKVGPALGSMMKLKAWREGREGKITTTAQGMG